MSWLPAFVAILGLAAGGTGTALGKAPDRFVDNARCAQCHRDIFGQWRESHHALAMQPATADTVLGDFNDTRFTASGVETRFFKRDGRFFVTTEGADGRRADFEVKHTFGIEPLQQVLLALPGGRLQAFTVAWDTARKTWFSLYPGEKIPPGDPLHWTGRNFTWNSSCAECHSTDLRLNYDPAAARYQTTWAEINVSCQACHGPGSRHADRPGVSMPVDFRALNAPARVDACAACHARRYPISTNDRPGPGFLDDFMPELLREGLYHADGQIRDEVFEYGSFLQSKMYQRGVACNDCHDPHTLRTRRPGNALCTGCHNPAPPRQRFASLAAKAYDTPAHHFHREGSAGAQCVACHAPTRTYMVVDPRHDHSFRIPRPDLPVKLGVPNACTQCHGDRPAQWAEARMTDWYGAAWKRPHYGEILAAGRAGKAEALPGLATLAKDSGQPAIVRATALELLRRYGEPARPTQTALLADPSPLMRTAAVQGLESADPRQFPALPRLLRDPVRAVRIEAARVLAPVPAAALGKADRAALAGALDEYRAAQTALADQPEGYANLGVLHAAMNRPDLAERAYRDAIRRDPGFFPAYNNLANLYHGQDRPDEAERILRAGLAAAPEQGALHYALGLLLAELQRWPEAAEALDRAGNLLPEEPRAHYNLGLLRQRLDQPDRAEPALRRALELRPEEPDFLYALAAFYRQQQRRTEAYPYAERLQRLYPGVLEYRRLAESLEPP